jgi:hypothetical protein
MGILAGAGAEATRVPGTSFSASFCGALAAYTVDIQAQD